MVRVVYAWWNIPAKSFKICHIFGVRKPMCSFYFISCYFIFPLMNSIFCYFVFVFAWLCLCKYNGGTWIPQSQILLIFCGSQVILPTSRVVCMCNVHVQVIFVESRRLRSQPTSGLRCSDKSDYKSSCGSTSVPSEQLSQVMLPHPLFPYIVYTCTPLPNL